MKITNTEVYGFEASLRGMRNPMNSWHLQDSCDVCEDYDCCLECEYYDESEKDCTHFANSVCSNMIETIAIGPNDMNLAKRLIKAGNEHCKFLRQIQVWADFDMPLYWWSEFDTYKFNTKNSCSTMHKLLNAKKEIELSDFVYDESEESTFKAIVDILNGYRKCYLSSKDYSYVIKAKRILPTSYKQKRTVNTNYAELRNIYFQRKNHRLKEEWQDVFCKWVESLPYAEELILYK